MSTLIETTAGVDESGLLQALKREYRRLAPDLRDAVKQAMLEHASHIPASAVGSDATWISCPPGTLGRHERVASFLACAASMASRTQLF